MLRFIVVVCRLLLVQPADIVKESAFSAVGCKDDDESAVMYHILDVCQYKLITVFVDGKKVKTYNRYDSMKLDGKKLKTHHFSDEKCKTVLTLDPNTPYNRTWYEEGTIDKCEEETILRDHDGNTTTPSQEVKTIKKFFEKMTGKPYVLVEVFDKKGCGKSDRIGMTAIYVHGDCDNAKNGTKEKGMSSKSTMDFKSQTLEVRSYSQKDCAGDAMDDKKLSFSIKFSDGCLQSPSEDTVWLKGELKDFSVDSLHNGTASGAFSMVPSWLGVALVALLWQH